MDQNSTPLLVEVFLHGARIQGYCPQVGPRRRLSEILNTPDDTLELERVEATIKNGEALQVHRITIEKKSIIAAIPWETQEQNRQRALTTSMTGRAKTIQLPVVVLSPPLVIAGMAHLPGGGMGTNTLRADPRLFPHFFSITEGRVTLDDGSFLDAPVVLVNRDVVSAMAQTTEPAKLRLIA